LSRAPGAIDVGTAAKARRFSRLEANEISARGAGVTITPATATAERTGIRLRRRQSLCFERPTAGARRRRAPAATNRRRAFLGKAWNRGSEKRQRNHRRLSPSLTAPSNSWATRRGASPMNWRLWSRRCESARFGVRRFATRLYGRWRRLGEMRREHHQPGLAIKTTSPNGRALGRGRAPAVQKPRRRAPRR